uniref:SPRY domain-containing protein n=1 Tax=Pygocentrus nattereri TaxID=42514 RepID=A0A3B4D5U8_PYGNA
SGQYVCFCHYTTHRDQSKCIAYLFISIYSLVLLTVQVTSWVCKRCVSIGADVLILASCVGVWGVGVATQKVNLHQVPLGRDSHSLVLRHDGSVYHNNEEKNRLPANSLPQEGDVVGLTYDHVELNLYLNGKNMQCPASGIRGTVFPVVYVDDSAILDCQFSDFYHTPPQGFEKILFEQQIF